MHLSAAEGPWPNWGRLDAPIDWPALIAAHPAHLNVYVEMLAENEGATWESITDAFAAARAVDPNAALDVCLWVSEEAKILIEPVNLVTSHRLAPIDADRVSTALIGGGRRRDRLHIEDDDAGRMWMLSC